MEYSKNQILEIKITDMGNDGEGIGKIDGYPFFIKDAVVGDRIRMRVVKVKKNYAYGRVEEIVSASPKRVLPPCPLYKKCGGCSIQAYSYEEQLKYKQKKVFNNLVRIGGFDEEFIESVTEDIIGMDNSFRYRNKAQYPVGTDKAGRIISGFYAGHSHDIVECSDCLLGIEENKLILDVIIDVMEQSGIMPYNEKSGRGIIRHILIRKGFTTGEIMVCIVVNLKRDKNSKEWFKGQQALVDRLSGISGIKNISLNFNTQRNNVIMGDTVVTLFGDDRIHDRLMGIDFAISPLAFYQVNPVQTEKLYSVAIEYASLLDGDEVWDICCGIGTIALSMASAAKLVHGIEIVPQAIDDAKENAKRNGITNSEFICAPAEEYLPKHADEIKADVVVLDPPRKGMEEAALDAVITISPERIVYVSCDSATLARDLKYLCGRGYQLKRVRPVDMFPHTSHVETVVLLSKGVVDKDNFRKVKVDFSLEDMDLTELRGKATYAQVKEYILNEFGLKVSSLYIAQVKKKCGIETGENHNLPKSEDARQPQVTPEKEEAIMKAFKHYGII